MTEPESGSTGAHLVQVLLPLRDPDGAAYPRELYDRLVEQLKEQFGGVTAYTRAPATGAHLVQVLLPLRDPDGAAYPRELYDGLAEQLKKEFGGVTAYTRAPATGLWESPSGETVRDQVVVYEVMVDRLEREWWAGFRRSLEAKFRQEELVVRAQPIVRL